ncbi:SAUR-like auxin-responsive protein family [Euphorbia peplus]|nr:SAUR-like auxin-responsive protein family [Euphorbia peplus]
MAMNAEPNLKVLMKLKVFLKKLQKGMLVQGGVKKGHFAVIAGKDGEEKRFVLEMEYLNDPAFVQLLEQAEEEYGFQQQGVLAIPCKPQELENILGGSDRRTRRRRSTEW